MIRHGLRCIVVAGLAFALAAGHAVAAGRAGEVVFTRGVATAEGADGRIRLLGRGAPLVEGDTVTTAQRSFAVLKLEDGTRMTVRPDSVFRLQEYVAREQQGSALMRLFKGGLRAVTGWISKRSPDAFRIRTSVATIGIRGTDFEARLCAADCLEEARRARGVKREAASPVAARMVFLRGEVRRTGAGGATRRLSLGASLYEGDVIETVGRSVAVLAFHDRTRVTLQPSTRFRIERNRYQPDKPAEGSMFLSLLRGGLRAITGLIGKSNRAAFRLATPVATIGIRGTGFDVQCQAGCVDTEPQSALPPGPPLTDPVTALLDSLVRPARAQGATGAGMFLSVWSGVVVLKMASGELVVGTDKTVFVPGNGGQPIPLPAIPLRLEGPRPDRPESTAPGMEDPFGGVEQSEPEPGLYLTIFGGGDAVVEDDGGNRVDIGIGETAYVGEGGARAVRVTTPPRLIVTAPPGLFDDPAIRNLYNLIQTPGEAPQRGFQCQLQ